MFSEEQSLKSLKSNMESFPDTLIILGSGWNRVLDKADIQKEVPYKNLFGVGSGVPGHDGNLIIATLKGKTIAFMSGRFHLYEGYTAYEATLPIRLFARVGLKNLVITSASGALNKAYGVGDMVIVSDLITLFLPSNPLSGPKFQDMSQALSLEWRQKAVAACNERGFPFQEGVYAYVPGPHFETPADKKLLSKLGADCVGMSTVPETIQARNLGINTLALSFITNLAFVKHAHKDVLAAAEAGSMRMSLLLEEIV